MKRKLLIIFSLILINCYGYCGIKDGFEALRKYDYFKAKQIFEKNLKKDFVAAGYGLATIYSLSNNPFFNVYDAHELIIQVKVSFKRSTVKERGKLLKYSIDSAAISVLKEKIDSTAYSLTMENATIDKLEIFIRCYPDAKQISQAINLAYKKACEENTLEAYKNFIDKFPHSDLVIEAEKKYELFLFLNYASQNTVESYESFITIFYNSPYINQAKDSIFHLMTKGKTAREYYHFALSHSDYKQTPDAWNQLYLLETYKLDYESFSKFRLNYPQYPDSSKIKLEIFLSNTKLYPVRKHDKWGYIDKQGLVVIPYKYDYVGDFSEGLADVEENEKVGYIKKTGEIQIPFSYEEGFTFQNGYAIIRKGEKYGIINKHNEVMLPIVYDQIGSFINGLAIIVRDGKYGYLSPDLKIAIPPKFNEAFPFKNEYAKVNYNDKFGFIDKKGNIIIPPDFISAENYDNFIIIKTDSLFGIINYKDSLLLPPVYFTIGNYSEGLILIEKKGKYGYADSSGNIRIPLKYHFNKESINESTFNHGFANIKVKDKYGLINRYGKTTIPAKYNHPLYYSEGLIPVKQDKKWGYMDTNKKMIIPYKFEEVFPFCESLARVRIKNKMGYIDKKGHLVIPDIYDETTNFNNGYAKVNISGKWGIINKSGKYLFTPDYDKFESLEDNKLYKLTRNNKFAYWNNLKNEFLWKEEGF